MTSRKQLERRVDMLEQRQEQLTELVQELVDLAPKDMDDTPMAQLDARTWQHPEIKSHIFTTVKKLVEQSPDRYVSRRSVVSEVGNEYSHTNAEIKTNLKILIKEGVLKRHYGRVRLHSDSEDLTADDLFRSNLDRAADRREYAAEKEKAVDNPDDKRN